MPRVNSFAAFFLPLLIAGALAAQDSRDKIYRGANAFWDGAYSAAPARVVIPLHGNWQASAEQPKFEAQVAVPGAFFFEGEVKFERTFQISDSLRHRTLRLHAFGINNEARIALNNEITATHIGGYTHFVVDLSNDVLRYNQDNTLSITVDNRLTPLHTLPPKHRPMGWRNAGGIFREIYIEVLPAIAIDNFETKHVFETDGVQVQVRAQVRRSRNLPPESVNGLIAELEVWDAQRLNRIAVAAPLALSTWSENRHDLALNCKILNPNLWSPETPALYSVRVVLTQNKKTVDEVWQETGFRRIEIVGKEMRLNGAPFVLRGVDWFEDYGGESALLDTTAIAQLITTLQQFGVNALRVVGHQPHPLLPVLCDRAGIFLLEELPFYYLTDAHFQHARFSQLAQLLAGEMQRRDRHHPSVLAWGLGTASAPLSAASQEEIGALIKTMRQADDRPLYVTTFPDWQKMWLPYADFLLVEWRASAGIETISAAIENADKPVLSVLGHQVSTLEAGSGRRLELARAEELQAEYFNRVLQTINNPQNRRGYFVHSLQDWQAPMPLLTIGPPSQPASHLLGATKSRDWGEFSWVNGSRVHPYGLIDSEGQRRLAFQVVQAFNHGDSSPTLVPRRLASSIPGTFQIVGIVLILIFLFFLQRDRRLVSNLKRVLVHPHGFFLDLYENRKVAPFLTLMLGLTESCILAVLLAQFGYAFRQSLIFDQLLNLLLDDAGWKTIAVWLIWNPGWFIFWGTLLTFCAGIVLALFFRILGIFFGSSVTISQYVTAVYWSWANVLVLGLLTPVFHRLLTNESLFGPLLIIITLVVFWQWGRMFRAFHVLYMISYFRAIIVFLFVFGGLLTAFLFYLDRSRALFQYLPYYFEMWQGIG